MSDLTEREQDYPATQTSPPSPAADPAAGGWYFATDLRAAWLPTFGQRPPIVLWSRLGGDPSPRPVWRLTPHTLAALRWRVSSAASVSAVAQDRLQVLIGLAAELYGETALLAAAGELEATGAPPPKFPEPDRADAWEVNWDCWTGPAVQAWLERYVTRGKHSA